MATLPQTLTTNYIHSGTSIPSIDGDWRWRTNYTLLYQSTSGLYSRIRVTHYIDFANQPSGATARSWFGWHTEGDTGVSSPLGNYAPPVGNSTKTWTYSDFTVYHNSAGYKTITLESHGGYSGNIVYASDVTVDLPRIYRYAQITSCVVTATSPADVTLTWATDYSIDQIEYKINGGAWTVTSGSGTGGTLYFGGLTPSTTYSFQIRVRRADSQLTTDSQVYYVTTHSLCTIVNASCDFNIGSDITLYTSRTNADYTQNLEVTIGSFNKTVISDFSEAGIWSTSEDENDIYAETPTSNTITGTFTLHTIKNEIDYGTTTRTFTATVTNANPIFTNYTYQDINAVTVALTGSNQKIIKGYSNLRAIITTANKAVAQKSATMDYYNFVVGEKYNAGDYSADSTVNIDLTAISNNIFNLYAIDSRQNSTLKQLSPATYIDYFKPTIPIVTADRTDDVEEETTLAFSGSFFNANFGSVTNDITATYKYKKTTDSVYTDGTTTLTVTKDGNTYSFSGHIAGDKGANGFDVQYSYDIQITITDELDSTVGYALLGKGSPNIDIFETGVSFGLPYDETEGGELQLLGKNILNLIFPIGRGFYDTTDTDYTNYLGFTWAKHLVGKFPVGKSTDTEFDTIGETGGAKTVTLTSAQSGLPAHSHIVKTGGASGGSTFYKGSTSDGITDDANGGGNAVQVQSNTATNASQSHNNLPPYEVVNFWKRTA